MRKAAYRNRIPLLALVILALLAAMWGGLLRLGWRWPALQPALPTVHGPLMVSGFLGTLIGLERAVALEHRWTYASPLLSAAGAVVLILGYTGALGPLLLALGSLGLVLTFVLIIRHQPALFTLTMGLGAGAWMVGNLLWLAGQPIYRVVLWWASFLVLTIVGERLELSRLLQLSRVSYASFGLAAALFVSGLVANIVQPNAGTRLAGSGLLALAMWLWRHDIARRTIHRPGLPRFISACLLSGYVWLGIGGLLALRFGGIVAGPRYDATLHSVFLGFVFAMIFGHAPIIFPAVLGRPIDFQPRFYLHLGLLHLSLALRVAGDLAGWWAARRWGGLFNVLVILLFLANTLYSLRVGKKPTVVEA